MTWVQIICGAPHSETPAPPLSCVTWVVVQGNPVARNSHQMVAGCKSHINLFSFQRKKKHISARIVVYFLMSSLSLLPSSFSHTHDINCTAIDRSRIPLCCAQVLVLFLAFPLHLYLACLFRNEKWNWVLRVARHQLPSSIFHLRLLQLQLQLLLSRFLLAFSPIECQIQFLAVLPAAR